MTKRYSTFKEFYPYYLSEHSDGRCRALHFVGSLCVLFLLIAAVVTSNVVLVGLVPLAGYGFAWIGHFAFERNKPATFDYPLYSLAADWVMLKDILIGRVPLFGELTTRSK